MLETLIPSKTRIKLLLKFFLNSSTTAYLRSLESEFGDSTNAIRLELNNLEKAGMLESFSSGNKKIFKANIKHPLFHEIHNLLLKHVGIDRVIEQVVERLGDVEKVFLVGSFANGIDSQVIDLLIVGDVNRNYLSELTEKAEKIVNRKISYVIYREWELNLKEFKQKNIEPLLLWSAE